MRGKRQKGGLGVSFYKCFATQRWNWNPVGTNMFRCSLCAAHGRYIVYKSKLNTRSTLLPYSQVCVFGLASFHIVILCISMAWEFCFQAELEQLCAEINRSLSITVLTLIWQSATWYVRVSWTCIADVVNRSDYHSSHWGTGCGCLATYVLPCSHSVSAFTLLKFFAWVLVKIFKFTTRARSICQKERKKHSKHKWNPPSHSSAVEQSGS